MPPAPIIRQHHSRKSVTPAPRKAIKFPKSCRLFHRHFRTATAPDFAMKSFQDFSFSSSTTVTFTFHDDHIPLQDSKQIPVESVVPEVDPTAIAAAKRIQSAYRAHVIRSLYKKISSVNSEADRLQLLIQRQETVDAIRSDEREKLRMNEALMALLLKLDSVPGIDPTVREGRRKISRRIVGLQEILDGISESKFDEDDYRGWGPRGIFSMRDWDKVMEEMEEEICQERGGDEMEHFCAQYLGFRCLQRFLRH